MKISYQPLNIPFKNPLVKYLLKLIFTCRFIVFLNNDTNEVHMIKWTHRIITK